MFAKSKLFASILVVFAVVSAACAGAGANEQRLTCRDELTGEPLDWFTLYKLPKEHETLRNNFFEFLFGIRLDDYAAKSRAVPFGDSGTAYTYITNKKQDWTLSGLSINDTSSMPGMTLSQLYGGNASDIGYVLYNDQADKVSIVKGHTKGVVLFNSISAVWIVHSIPNYPPKRSTGAYSIHPSQCIFGQSMLCMSFNVDQLPLVGQQLVYNYPQIYDFAIPDTLRASPLVDNIAKATQAFHVPSAPWFNVNMLTTAGGEQMISFAKTAQYAEDLYSGLVAPTLKSNMLTETWNNGRGTLVSNCSANVTYHVMNIEHVKFDSLNLKFSVHHDHSKWAVTNKLDELDVHQFLHDSSTTFVDDNDDDDASGIVCIGDINRQVEQFKRGGGTVCFMNNRNVWLNYYKLVGDIETCPRVHRRKTKTRKFTSPETSETLILL